jgi:hypothetical protein
MPLSVLNRPRKAKSNILNQNHCVNRNNLIRIQTKEVISGTQKHNRLQTLSCLPTFFHSNVRSLNAKIDDLQIVTQQNNADVIAITETWLNSRITDGAVSLPGYSIVRNDRENGKRGGGVCAFIKSNIPFSTIPNLCTPDVEGSVVKTQTFPVTTRIVLHFCWSVLPSTIS